MDFTPLVESLQTIASPQQILAIIAVVAGAAGGLVLTWFGARKIGGAIMSALKKGKLSF